MGNIGVCGRAATSNKKVGKRIHFMVGIFGVDFPFTGASDVPLILADGDLLLV
jgi:hypothetical protein